MTPARVAVAACWCIANTALPAAAGYWESYGVCSYHLTEGSLENLELVAESACHEVTGSGTGILSSTYTWDSGQVMTHVVDVQPNLGIHSETLNDRRVLQEIHTAAGICWVVKEDAGFSASCFRRIGESF